MVDFFFRFCLTINISSHRQYSDNVRWSLRNGSVALAEETIILLFMNNHLMVYI